MDSHSTHIYSSIDVQCNRRLTSSPKCVHSTNQRQLKAYICAEVCDIVNVYVNPQTMVDL